MTEFDNFSVCNSFRTDVKGKGKLAEEDFINYFYNNPKNNGKTLHDVRNNPLYQYIDIDFIIDNDGFETLPNIDEVIYNKSRFIKIEVKYNGCALNTGKYAFEVISHSNLGWGVNTKCDYLYTLFGQNNSDGSYTPLKRGIIDFKEWKKFIRNKNNYRKVNYNKGENVIVDFLTDINDMIKNGILIFV